MTIACASAAADAPLLAFSCPKAGVPHGLADTARLLLPHLERGQRIDAVALRDAMERAFGGSDAAGAWDWKAAYDACEAATVLFLRKFGPAIRAQAASPAGVLQMLGKIAALLPTHTRRSQESQALQQFSTPIELAFVAAVAGALGPADIVLEPSAGTGLLAIFAELAGSKLVLNELAEVRAGLLHRLFPDVSTTRHDAAHIHDHLDAALRPSVLLMNPPFSVAAHVDGAVADAALFSCRDEDVVAVRVSSCHPIKAKKARYFEDPQLQARILPPPVPSTLTNVNDASGVRRGQDAIPWAEAIVPVDQPAEDPDNAGIRREPELPEQEEVVLDRRKPVREFDLAWLIVVVSFFIMAIQLFVGLIEFKLTTLAGFVLVPFGLFGRTAFLAEKVLGNVFSSGVKVLVLAVIVGIGSTIFGQFTSGFNNPPTIDDALTLILASLALLGLSIFGAGIANGLVAGGPQLGAGAAVGTGMAVAGVGAAGATLAVAGAGAAAGAIGGATRAGASVAGGATAAFRTGGMGGVASAAGTAAASPLRRAATNLSENFHAGGRAATGGRASSDTPAGDIAEASRPPAWASRMRRRETTRRAASAAEHALRSGDRSMGGSSVDLSQG